VGFLRKNQQECYQNMTVSAHLILPESTTFRSAHPQRLRTEKSLYIVPFSNWSESQESTRNLKKEGDLRAKEALSYERKKEILEPERPPGYEKEGDLRARKALRAMRKRERSEAWEALRGWETRQGGGYGG